MDEDVRIGIVLPLSGRLAHLGDPLAYCAERMAPLLAGVAGGDRRVRLVGKDSRSEPGAARRAVRELAADPRMVLVVTMAGTEMVPAIAAECRDARIPCLSTTLPWQVYRGMFEDDGSWGAHFCWGLGDIGAVFAGLWRTADPDARVGCLWNDGAQGEHLRGDDPTGFRAAAKAEGFEIHDPGGHPEGVRDFGPYIARLREAGVTVVTTAATAADLGRFRAQAAAVGWTPKLITSSRWLAYPDSVHPGGEPPAPDSADDVATLVYWTPRHPFHSSLDDTTPRTLARDYRRETGRAWLQPLGLAHALLEVAAHALGVADDAADRAAVATALSGTSLDTLAGSLDWTRGPAPGVAGVPLVAGQWQRLNGSRQLVTVANTALPEVPVESPLAFGFGG
ncbi:ABC transporter substrate-binding protein [Thermomonospora umbrina]|uniref:Amino acid/amide ABC transporter substrate-binding protein (HAAT family) n=1 Tax=Thermomonospora umbrina TaxID=111806 RepID=A0A3D9T7F6_9ACTN|nr:ABC transporter substrate-binding protein [Thermomonospora umbrina]REF01176.1 amino acid/amide ABC transporter substrate-binding protein (HAAT family) [Thermomonospora umbrina]